MCRNQFLMCVVLCLMTLGALSVEGKAMAEAVGIREQIFCVERGGERIEGRLCLPAEGAQEGKETYPTVILSHGFGGNCDALTGEAARALAREGFAAYAFNFRNPDTRSMINTSVLTEAKTLSLVIEGLLEEPFTDRDNLFLLGESQGGFVSSYVAAKSLGQNIRGLVLYYPAFVLQDDARKRNPGYDEEDYEFPETEMALGTLISGTYSRDALSFDIYDLLPSYPGDVLIVHGTKDRLVPLSYSERALNAFPHAELMTVPGAGHGFYGTRDFPDVLDATIEFLKKQIAGGEAP